MFSYYAMRKIVNDSFVCSKCESGEEYLYCYENERFCMECFKGKILKKEECECPICKENSCRSFVFNGISYCGYCVEDIIDKEADRISFEEEFDNYRSSVFEDYYERI